MNPSEYQSIQSTAADTTQPYLSFIPMLFDRIAGVSRDAAAAADKNNKKDRRAWRTF